MTAEPSKPQAQGDVIVIPKHLRAEWMDCMALDSELSHVAFRAAGVIGFHFNRYTGKTFLSQETLARVMGVSERTAYGATKELERRGWLIIRRREFGTIDRKTPSGKVVQVKVAGGKGVANTYYPAFQRSQLAATFRGSKLATSCNLWWEQRSQKTAPKVATSCDPTLTSSSKKNPTASPQPNQCELPEPAATRLRKRLGEGVFAAWFGQVKLVSVCGDTVTLSIDTKFKRTRIVSEYGDACIAAFKAIDPLIERLAVVVEAAR